MRNSFILLLLILVCGSCDSFRKLTYSEKQISEYNLEQIDKEMSHYDSDIDIFNRYFSDKKIRVTEFYPPDSNGYSAVRLITEINENTVSEIESRQSESSSTEKEYIEELQEIDFSDIILDEEIKNTSGSKFWVYSIIAFIIIVFVIGVRFRLF